MPGLILASVVALVCCSTAVADVRGRVVDEGGGPVAGAWVQVAEGERLLPAVRAGADGSFSARTSGERVLLRASAPGYSPGYAQPSTRAAVNLVLKKRDTHQLTLTVLDENGQPRANAELVVQEAADMAQIPRPLDSGKYTFQRLSSPENPLKPYPPVRTDFRGVARLTVNRDETLQITSRYDELGWVQRIVRPEQGKAELNLGSAAHVDGIVQTATGCALREGSGMSWVRQHGSTPVSRLLQLSADGTFSTSRPYLNPYDLKTDTPVQIVAPAPFDPGPMEAGQYEVIIALSSLKTLTRTVTLNAGANAPVFNVADIGRLVVQAPPGVWREGAELRARGIYLSNRAPEATEGEIDLGCLEAGESEVSFWSPDAGWDRLRATIRASETTTVKLNPKAGGQVSGQWTQKDFLPYSFSAADGATSYTVRPRADGTFVFRNLPPGQWEVTAMLGKTGLRSETAKVTLSGTETAHVKIGYRAN